MRCGFREIAQIDPDQTPRVAKVRYWPCKTLVEGALLQMSDKSTPIKGVTHTAEEAGQKMKKRGLKGWAFHEAKRLFAMFLYLYILFALLLIHEYIVLAQHQIKFTHYGFAFVNAWIFAKVMLVAEDLHFGRGFEDRPLVYPVLFKAVAFTIVFICFRVVEDVVVGMWQGKTVAASIPAIGGGGLEGIVSAGLIVTFALLRFVAHREAARVIGEQ